MRNPRCISTFSGLNSIVHTDLDHGGDGEDENGEGEEDEEEGRAKINLQICVH